MMKPGDRDCNTGKRARHRTAFPARQECDIWRYMIDWRRIGCACAGIRNLVPRLLSCAPYPEELCKGEHPKGARSNLFCLSYLELGRN